jgi:hypothetical protein
VSHNGGAYRHLAVVHATTHAVTCLSTASDGEGDEEWLAACYRLTARLQLLGSDAALLDLGPCTEAEAAAALQALLVHLCAERVTARAAIGPSGVLAQLALLHAPTQELLVSVTPEQVEELLRQLPVAALARLRLPASRAIGPAVVAQLNDYGVRSLAQLAQLARRGEEPLRRQFGGRVGATLAALARGEDPLPLQPTPPAERLHVRLRLAAPLTVDRLIAALPRFTAEIAAALARRGQQAQTLELRVRWEDGASPERLSRTLPYPLAEAPSLADALAQLLAPLLAPLLSMDPAPVSLPPYPSQPHSARWSGVEHLAHLASREHRAIDDVQLVLSGLTPQYPEQQAFWPQRVKRLAAVERVAAVLARRHGTPLLLRAATPVPDAIFPLDRYRLLALDAEVPAPSRPLRPPRPIPSAQTRQTSRAAQTAQASPVRSLRPVLGPTGPTGATSPITDADTWEMPPGTDVSALADVAALDVSDADGPEGPGAPPPPPRGTDMPSSPPVRPGDPAASPPRRS